MEWAVLVVLQCGVPVPPFSILHTLVCLFWRDRLWRLSLVLVQRHKPADRRTGATSRRCARGDIDPTLMHYH